MGTSKMRPDPQRLAVVPDRPLHVAHRLPVEGVLEMDRCLEVIGRPRDDLVVDGPPGKWGGAPPAFGARPL